MTNTNIPTHGINDTRRADLDKLVKKFGGEAALGKDAMPKLAQAVLRAAADDVITGDDAEALYGTYLLNENTKLIHEQKKSSSKAQVSKLRQIINMGLMRSIDPVEVMQEAFDVREAMKADGEKGLKSAYAFYVDVAREQLKTDTALTRSELREIATKPQAEKDLLKELEGMVKKLEGIISGENRYGMHDDSQNVIDAYDALKARVTAIMVQEQRNALIQEAAKLGAAVTF